MEIHGIKIYEKKIRSLIGEKGFLEKIEFEDGETVLREGGFITPEWQQATDIGLHLGCKLNERGGIETDSWKKTSVDGLYACGDTLMAGPSQLILVAGEGSMAAISINGSLIEEKFM